MKTILFLGALTFGASETLAQNTAIISKQGGSNHTVSVNQQGNGNTSVVSQNKGTSGNQAIISQSGSGNVATINQGNQPSGIAGQSVSVTQSGGGETHIDQTDGNNNHIIINQTSEPAQTPADPKSRKRSKRETRKSGR